jgi:hypothetical protein
MDGAADTVNGVPDAHSNARTEYESNGLRLCGNEDLTGMKKMSSRGG